MTSTISSGLLTGAAEFLEGIQTEIILFLVAVIAHSVIFGKYKLPVGKNKGKGLEPAKPRTNKVPGGRAQQGDRSAQREQEESSPYAGLIKAAPDGSTAEELFLTAASKKLVTDGVLVSAAQAAFANSSETLAQAVLAHLPSQPPAEVAASLLQLRAGAKGKTNSATATSVLQMYEEHFKLVELSSDFKVQRLVIDAALKLERSNVIAEQIALAPSFAQQVALIKSFGSRSCSDRPFDDAKTVFDACPEKHACHYNALLDVCVECKDIEAAAKVMACATFAGSADVVTYNTLLKAHLRVGSLKNARAILDLMRNAGLPPNRVTFNELLDATLAQNPREVWSIVDEMKACGHEPNHVTCSILLKGIQPKTPSFMVERTMAVVEKISDEMDEVLLGSVAEACVRVGRADLLHPLLKRQNGVKRIPIRGAHTYGSIIRAYGAVNDLQGVWESWREMRSRHIACTSITLGCMVEALVTNGDPDAGYELIQEVRADQSCCNVVNAVIYCSVLKGFSHQKRYDRVWMVYDEMIEQKIEFSIVTYNALVDACARSADMSRVPKLLKDMSEQGLKPNLISYSSILKGYCQENKLDQAFELLECMRQTTEFLPDEIMYNSLLDGCARQGFYERGMVLLDEMQKVGIKPSNFTLSILVKLASRGRNLNTVFALCEEVKQKYSIKLNTYVYSNLIHACVTHKDLAKGLQLLEQMALEGVKPDVRSYTLLLRACISVDDRSHSAGLLRLAFGLPGAGTYFPGLQKFGANVLRPQGADLPAQLVNEVLERIAFPSSGPCRGERGGGMVKLGKTQAPDALALELLHELKRSRPNFHVDPKLKFRLTTQAMHDRP